MPPELSKQDIAKKRDQLVLHALNICETDGPDALTLRRLATVASVSRTTPYLYFKDKSDLLEAVRIHGFNLLADTCEQALIGHDGHVKQMRVLGETYVKFALERPLLYTLIFETNMHADLSTPLIEAMERYNSLISTPMQKAFEAGIISMSPDRLSPVLWAATHGLLSLKTAGLLGDDTAFAKVQADLNQVLAMGFVAKPK